MKIALAQVRVGKRLRSIRDDAVTELMQSIQELGLRTPITVASAAAKRDGGGQDVVVFDLIAGNHRLEACRRLGWAEIEADVVLMTPAQRELWEIDENLKRADLTELERGEHLVRRKAVYEKTHPETRAATGSELAQKRWGNAAENFSAASFAADTAAKVGVTDRSIRQAIRRIDRIDEKLRDRIRSNAEIADSGVELDALAAMEPAEQKQAVALVEAGQATSVRDAHKIMMKSQKPQPIQSHFKEAEVARQKRRAAYIKAWNALDEEDREWALAEIDRPVADNASLRVVS